MLKYNKTVYKKSTQKCNTNQKNESFDFNKLIIKFRIYFNELSQGGTL